MKSFWRGKKIVVTAGPTREFLDPVRFISNSSSGRMGYALAEAARDAGARVTLVSGPTFFSSPRKVKTIDVVSAGEMLRETLRESVFADAVVGAAAPADFRPSIVSPRKIKKRPSQNFKTLRLIKNPDILKTVSAGKNKGKPLLVGFALETEDLLLNARRKMEEKGLDIIVANTPESLQGENTRAVLLRPGRKDVFFRGTKKELARLILRVMTESAGD